MCPNQLVFNYNCIIFPEIQKDQMIVCLKDTHHVRFIRYTYTYTIFALKNPLRYDVVVTG